MNKKGFTLIELLAVIVVLSIILVIAVPRVLNVIEEADKEAFRITGEQLVKSAIDRLEMNSMYPQDDKTYVITDGAFVGESIPMSGKLPDNGVINITSNGLVSIAVSDEKWCATKTFNSNEINISKDVTNCFVLEDTPISCFVYEIVGEEVSITEYDEGCTKNVVIPNTIEEKPVTTIGDYAFSNYQLLNVIIPNSVTSIGEEAFSYNQMSNITIPTSLTSLGFYAFADNLLTSVTIPSSLTIIEEGAFSYNQISTVTIPNGVTSIGTASFAFNQLTNLIIPTSVIDIEPAAFTNNQLPDNQAFIYDRNPDGSQDATKLIGYGGAKKNGIVIPTSVNTIKYGAFYYSGISSITIPNTVHTIEDMAFYLNNLSSITIPPNVTKINNYAFSTNNLTSVTIPANVDITIDAISPTFYLEYVTNKGSAAGTYTAPFQTGTWTKQP